MYSFFCRAKSAADNVSQVSVQVHVLILFIYSYIYICFLHFFYWKLSSLDLTVPPLLRYGKYCGLLYSGCPGEKPCDGLDACCMKHDQCVTVKNSKFYLYIFLNYMMTCVSDYILHF